MIQQSVCVWGGNVSWGLDFLVVQNPLGFGAKKGGSKPRTLGTKKSNEQEQGKPGSDLPEAEASQETRTGRSGRSGEDWQAANHPIMGSDRAWGRVKP